MCVCVCLLFVYMISYDPDGDISHCFFCLLQYSGMFIASYGEMKYNHKAQGPFLEAYRSLLD